MQMTAVNEFLSTPSARRATSWFVSRYPGASISIHALREEGDMFIGNFAVTRFISIHALREEGDVTAAHRASVG